MNEREIKRRFPNASPAFIRANCEMLNLGSLPPTEPKRSGRRKSKASNADQTRSAFRVVVSIIGLRKIPLDDDNFVGACKHVRDAIAASIGFDDGDKRLRWQYQQVQTSGEEGLIVRIEIV